MSTEKPTGWEVRVCGLGPGPGAVMLHLCEVSPGLCRAGHYSGSWDK